MRQNKSTSIEGDEQYLPDPDYFYWTIIRPAEEAAENRKAKRAARKAKRAMRPAEPNIGLEPHATTEMAESPTEEALIDAIETIIRATHHAYGWRHLGELGQQLRQRYPTPQWSDYSCKKLLDFLGKYPARFKIKWSAPAHKGASHVWVRIAYEPKVRKGSSK
jgi:hypothetical protein